MMNKNIETEKTNAINTKNVVFFTLFILLIKV